MCLLLFAVYGSSYGFAAFFCFLADWISTIIWFILFFICNIHCHPHSTLLLLFIIIPWFASSLSSLLFYFIKSCFLFNYLMKIETFSPLIYVLLCWWLYFIEIFFFDTNLLVQHHWFVSYGILYVGSLGKKLELAHDGGRVEMD